MDKVGDELKLADCACRNLRMTTRVMTQYYDKMLKKSGLKVTQFSLLNSIDSQKDGISVNDLADLAMMDQTTATRNIEILRKAGYVNVNVEDTDTRKKRITVSDLGKKMISDAMPYWQEAQLKVQKLVGTLPYQNFVETMELLQKIE